MHTTESYADHTTLFSREMNQAASEATTTSL